MGIDRRCFLKSAGACALGAVVGPAAALGSSAQASPSEGMGVLVDSTFCIGCRKCEFACNEANDLSDKPLESFEDKSVFETQRRMESDSFTVVNRYADPKSPGRPTNVKIQCMHCLHPACESACLVGAFDRQENGAVTYKSWKCMGCRYCMVACPFGVPAYEYDHTLAPRVRKCTFCFERTGNSGRRPACVEICPVECLTYGKRSDLLALARERIESAPDQYVDHIYGEHEVGGTAWLYLASQPFEDIGFLELGERPIPEYTESIQHSVFKYGAAPALLFAVLGASMKVFKDSDKEETPGQEPESPNRS